MYGHNTTFQTCSLTRSNASPCLLCSASRATLSVFGRTIGGSSSTCSPETEDVDMGEGLEPYTCAEEAVLPIIPRRSDVIVGRTEKLE